MEARVRDAGHHRELLVRIGQAPEELEQIVDARDPSHWPRMTMVGTVILSGSTSGSFEQHVHVVPVGTESSSATMASAKALTVCLVRGAGWSG